MNEIVIRTREGVDALLASVTTSLDEPERIGYLALGELTAWSRVFRWSTVRTVATPTLFPLLASSVARGSGDPVLLAGLAGGLVGDLAKLSAPDTTPVLGMFGVAANHAAYSLTLVDKGARPSRVGAGLRAAAWATGVGLAAWRKKQLLAPAIVAGAFVSASSTLAGDPILREGSTPAKGLAHGANLLLLSEGMALLRETVVTGESFWCRKVDAGITVSGVIGHMLVVDGLTRE